MNKKHEVKFPGLAAEMARRGHRQQDLADLLKVDKSTICNKLKGKTDWTVGEVETLCDFYNEDYYYLFK